MEHFRINQPGYEMPEPEPKWQYTVGTFVVAVKDFSESLSINVRTA